MNQELNVIEKSLLDKTVRKYWFPSLLPIFLLLCLICLFQNHRWEVDRLQRGALFLVLIASTGVPQGSLLGLPLF